MDLLVNIDVDDIGKAERFYCSAFDLQVARRFGGGALELTGGSSRVYLLAKAAGSQAAGTNGPTRTYERHWTPIHLDFVVDDIDRALQRSLAAGAMQEGPVRTSSWGKLVLMCDPFGHGYCLLQFTGNGYDEIAS
jgi:lactoylglutathione lyase